MLVRTFLKQQGPVIIWDGVGLAVSSGRQQFSRKYCELKALHLPEFRSFLQGAVG